MLSSEMEEGTVSQEICREPFEVGRGKEADSLLEPPRRHAARPGP